MMPNVTDLYAGRPPELENLLQAPQRHCRAERRDAHVGGPGRLTRLAARLFSFLL